MSSNGMITTRVEVRGVRQAINALKDVDDKLYWSAIGEIKKAAQPIAAKVDSNFPTLPGRGWVHNGRTAWKKKKPTVIQYGGRQSGQSRKKGEWQLLRIRVVDAPRMIFDMAGAANSGSTLDSVLTDGYGKASRAVWRAAPFALKETRGAIKDAIKKVTRETNRRLEVYK